MTQINAKFAEGQGRGRGDRAVREIYHGDQLIGRVRKTDTKVTLRKGSKMVHSRFTFMPVASQKALGQTSAWGFKAVCAAVAAKLPEPVQPTA